MWSANALIGTTFDARLRATHILSIAPEQHFSLGSAMIIMAGLGADVALTDRLHANFGVDYEQFDYGRSATNVYGNHEPHSRTQQVTLKAGLGLGF